MRTARGYGRPARRVSLIRSPSWWVPSELVDIYWTRQGATVAVKRAARSTNHPARQGYSSPTDIRVPGQSNVRARQRISLTNHSASVHSPAFSCLKVGSTASDSQEYSGVESSDLVYSVEGEMKVRFRERCRAILKAY